ncbi:MAG: hypothetical protein ACRD7E_03330 [Bryobacteraceae bacterium]
MIRPTLTGRGAARPAFLIFSLALLLASSGRAQMTCHRLDAPVDVRAEGTAELVSDIVLSCTGGIETSPGGPVPHFQVLVSANTAFSNRVLVPTSGTLGWNDALLLIGEPAIENQLPCSPPAGVDICPQFGHEPHQANVFQGRQLQDNVLVFQGIPIDPPGQDRKRILRITNLRANITGLPRKAEPEPVKLTVQIFTENGDQVNVTEPEHVAAKAQPALSFSVRSAMDDLVQAPVPALTLTPSMLPREAPQASRSFNVKFSEGFATAFKRRNIGSTGADPVFITSQAIPGTLFHTESGFLSTAFPALTKMDEAGLAASGTRLKVVFHNLPSEIKIWVSIRDVQPGTTAFSAENPKALLTYTDSDGAGPFSRMHPWVPGFAQLFVSEGTATAVWEMVSSDPGAVEDLSFAVALTAQNGAPGLGTATVNGSLAPTSSIATEEASVVPRFVDKSTPIPAFTISNNLQVPRFTAVSAASFNGLPVAPGSIVSGFGSNLSPETKIANGSLPEILADTAVDVIDSVGTKRSAQLFVVSPGQINFLLDPATRTGPAVVNVTSGGRLTASGLLQVEDIAPGLFSAGGDGRGPAAGEILRIGGGTDTSAPLAGWDADQKKWFPIPIDLGSEEDLVYVTLYGTGIRGRSSLSAVSATIGGESVPAIFAGPQDLYPGLDQINVGPLPRVLEGRGEVDLTLSVDGKTSNRLSIHIR